MKRHLTSSIALHLSRRAEEPPTTQLATATGYARGLLEGSPQVGAGHLLYALEYQHEGGPWQVPDNYNKFNGAQRDAYSALRTSGSRSTPTLHGRTPVSAITSPSPRASR
jgi:hypothetical protein